MNEKKVPKKKKSTFNPKFKAILFNDFREIHCFFCNPGSIFLLVESFLEDSGQTTTECRRKG